MSLAGLVLIVLPIASTSPSGCSPRSCSCSGLIRWPFLVPYVGWSLWLIATGVAVL